MISDDTGAGARTDLTAVDTLLLQLCEAQCELLRQPLVVSLQESEGTEAVEVHVSSRRGLNTLREREEALQPHTSDVGAEVLTSKQLEDGQVLLVRRVEGLRVEQLGGHHLPVLPPDVGDEAVERRDLIFDELCVRLVRATSARATGRSQSIQCLRNPGGQLEAARLRVRVVDKIGIGIFGPKPQCGCLQHQKMSLAASMNRSCSGDQVLQLELEDQ